MFSIFMSLLHEIEEKRIFDKSIFKTNVKSPPPQIAIW